MKTHRIFASVVLGLFLAVMGRSVPASAPASAQADRLRVVASFSILADVVSQVAGDAAQIETLIPVGANPHAYEPSARDVVRLSEADAVFVVGLNFEERLLDVVREASGGAVYELGDCLPIRPVIAGLDDHGEEAGHADETSSASNPGDTLDALCTGHWETVRAAFGLEALALPGAVTRADAAYPDTLAEADPHVWTDPVNVALWTLMIRDRLSAEDPANAPLYATNAEAYLEQLATLHAEIAAQMAALPAERRYIVTNHLAFNYLAARYGLTLVGVVIPGGGTSSEPSVREVLALIETVRSTGVPAIFTETTVSESLARQIADESGATLVRLYTGSLSEPGGPADTYLAYMRFNAAQIVAALE
ncbi:MAG: zinc ABC transporter substrate-binding protein [Anaerolineae bacterium]|nr:zinc ABC transporter substrate-binding protein [Anaerolineae bacterium]